MPVTHLWAVEARAANGSNARDRGRYNAAREPALTANRRRSAAPRNIRKAVSRRRFHQLVVEAIRTNGTLDVPLPAAPPPFHFSEPETCTAALLEAGFINPRVSEVPLAFRPSAREQVLDLTYSAVRLR